MKRKIATINKHYEDEQEQFDYMIKRYVYNFLGEILELTKPEMSFVKLLHYAIEKKCSREVYNLFKNKRKKVSIKLHILSYVEMKLRKINSKKEILK